MNILHRLQMPVAILLVILCSASAYADIVFTPDALVLDPGTTSGVVVVTYDGSEPLYGYSLDIQWNHTLATAAPADFTRPVAGPFSGAATFFVLELGDGHVRVDAAIGGAHAGITSGELFKVTFTAVDEALGTSGINLTIEYLRDPDNQDIPPVNVINGLLDVDMLGMPKVENVLIVNNTLGHTNDFVKDTDDLTITAEVTDYGSGLTTTHIKADLTDLGLGSEVVPDSYSDPDATWLIGPVGPLPLDGLLTIDVTVIDDDSNTDTNSDSIIADNTAPDPLLGVTVTPGHQKLHLSWTDIGNHDDYPWGVDFRYAVWGDYPFYDGGGPAYPTNNGEGDPAVQDTSGTSTDWLVDDRDIYYVAGFVYDRALNYSSAGSDNQGRATNYWLGDVDSADPGVGDGVVDVPFDITKLGNTYGLIDTDGGFDEFCNVGPTDSSSRLGVPMPNIDNEIGFEDMMIFALNFDVVTPLGKVVIGGTPVLAWNQVNDTTWALSLVDRGGDLQGLNLRAELPEGVDCTVAAGDLLAEQSVPVFLRNMPRPGVDAGLALFGQGVGFSGSGELVRVTLSEPVADIEVTVTARDADNKDLGVELGSRSPSAVPAVASLAQNYPNPFNPSTTLTFELPQERQVHLAIYALDGTRVRTLVEGMREAGHHEISWDGRDETGRSVAAGTYFARVSTGDFNQIRKMVLVK